MVSPVSVSPELWLEAQLRKSNVSGAPRSAIIGLTWVSYRQQKITSSLQDGSRPVNPDVRHR